MKWKASALVRGYKWLRQEKPWREKAGRSVHGHQSFPRAAECQLNSESGRQQQINFPGLDFLKVTCGDLSFFGQLILSPTPTHAFAANICSEDLDPFPFFFGDSHDILHRFYSQFVNDTYIVKKIQIY